MYRIRTALLSAALVLILSATVASADFGSFTAPGGESCTWNGFGSSITMYCSGYSRGTYVNYSCDLQYYGSSMSYQCRDQHGARWSGSR